MRDSEKIFDACQKAVGVVFTEGTCTDDQKRDITSGLRALLEIIKALASGNTPYLRYVESALHDVHPGVEYDLYSVIRDLADVCLTLSRLEQGRTRKDQMKLAEATLFCQLLRDEVREEA